MWRWMSLISTNDDATAARHAAAKAGYINDEYVSIFTKKNKGSPLINRGTALRTSVITSLILEYSKKFKKVQVVSLGAGFDTRYFTLPESEIYYWEIDFPQVIQKKIMIIQKSNILSSKLEQALVMNGNLKSTKYNLIGGDLRNHVKIREQLIDSGLDAQIPTIILSECCLIYLEVDQSNNLIKDFIGLFQTCSFLVYEQIEPKDAFGKMMIQNLAERGITLHGMLEYPTLESQLQRFKALGCGEVKGWNMLQALDQLVPSGVIVEWNQRGRLDEVEEWNLFCRHYFILFAQK